jgi:hypothetical protein
MPASSHLRDCAPKFPFAPELRNSGSCLDTSGARWGPFWEALIAGQQETTTPSFSNVLVPKKRGLKTKSELLSIFHSSSISLPLLFYGVTSSS